MVKSVPLVVRLPLGVYDEVKKAVDEKGLASSYSGFCRQVVTEKIIDITSHKTSEAAETKKADCDE